MTEDIDMSIENKSLCDIERDIISELKNCSYWGELSINEADYKYLCERLRDHMPKDRTSFQIKWLFDCYPVCTVTTIIFYTVFYYNNDEETSGLWGPWSEKLGMELKNNHSSEIGKNVIQVFKKHKMTKYETDGLKYVTPILCQAGVPDSHLDDIFYAIVTNQRFDAHEIMAEFKSWRAKYIKKPLERFIRCHEDKALELIVSVHDVILEGSAGNNGNYEERIYKEYSKWKKENLDRAGNLRGKSVYKEKPYLILDDDKGLCMVLPEFVVEEYCDSIKWKIFDEKKEVIFDLECQVLNEGNRKHSAKKIVPVISKKKYDVRIFDADNVYDSKLLEDWEIDGLADQQYMLFGNNGKKRNDEMFTYEGGTLIVCDDLDNVRFENIFETEVFMPNNDGVKIYSFFPDKSKASIELNNRNHSRLELRRSIRVDLQGGTYLFNDKESGVAFPIYTNEPYVRIGCDDGEFDRSFSMVIRNRDTGFKKTVDLNNIDELEKQGDFISLKALSAFGIAENAYGRYVIKFYVKGMYKKELEFAYVPYVVFDDTSLRLWPNDKGTFLLSEFRYKEPEGIKISFISRVNDILENHNKESRHLVKSNEPVEFIKGEIVICSDNEDNKFDGADNGGNFVIPFRKRIRNLQWMKWCENDIDTELSYSEGKIDKKEIESSNWSISISMKKLKEGERCFLELESLTGEVLQQVPIKPNGKGKWHVGMGTFMANIDERKPPLIIRFKYESETQTITFKVLEIYESVILRGLKVMKLPLKNTDGEEVKTQSLVWNPAPDDYNMENLVVKSLMDFDMEDIKIKNIKKGKLNGKSINFMAFDDELPYGLYKLAYGEEDFFDFGHDEFEPPTLTYENTFVIDSKRMRRCFKDRTVRGLLDLLSTFYKSTEKLVKISEQIKGNDFEGTLTLNQLRRLMIFAIYGLKEPNGQCEKYILDIIKVISRCLKPEDKSCLVDIIVNAELKESEKKKMIKFFDLYYVAIKQLPLEETLLREKIDTIMSVDTFIGTRSIMKCKMSRWVLDRLCTNLGSDILKKLIKKLPNGSKRIEANDEIFGDIEAFYKMFNWDSYNCDLDISKKPDDELIFWGDGFINLMVKWHRNGLGKDSEKEKETSAAAEGIERLASSIIKISDDRTREYFEKTKVRRLENSRAFYTFIAASVKAGMIFALYDLGKINLPNDNLKTLMDFINGMDNVFPELIKRDILMAELFLYLKEV